MEKLEVYKDLYRLMRYLKPLKISERPALKGNLAYFVDRCYGRADWQNKIHELLGLIYDRDTNGACWFLSSEICREFEEQYPDKAHRADVLAAQLNNVLDLKVYSDGCLEDFEVVAPEFYPAFFVAYERQRAATPV